MRCKSIYFIFLHIGLVFLGSVSVSFSFTAAAQNGSVEASVTGHCIRAVSGKTLSSANAGKNFIPASNMKTISCGLALKACGTDARLKTVLAHSGEIDEDGRLDGNLYIIGGADPSLGYRLNGEEAEKAVICEWCNAVKNAGITVIDGNITACSDAVEAEYNGSWMYEDYGTYFGAVCSGLMFNANRINCQVSPGKSAGEPVSIRPHNGYPWLILENKCVTADAGTGDRTYLYLSEFAPAGRFAGTYAVDKPRKTVAYNNPFADFTCAWRLCEGLAAAGISCRGVSSTSSSHPLCVFERNSIESPPSFSFVTSGNAVAGPCRLSDPHGLAAAWHDHISIADSTSAIPDSLTTITTHYSPTMENMVRTTLYESNNLYAEALLHMLAGTEKPLRTTGESLKKEAEMLAQLGIDCSNVRIADGSGLSRKNSVSPEFLTAFLAAMAETDVFPAYLDCFPTAEDAAFLTASEPELRRRVRVKSGSMSGVLCYCGYVLPRKPGGQILVFSLMSNGNVASYSRMRRHLEDILLVSVEFSD